MSDAQQAPDLSMPHVTQSVADAKKAIQKRINPTEDQKKAEADEADSRTREAYTFTFDFTDSQGKRWAGKFTNKVRTIMDRQLQANIQAGWQGGIPHNAYDPDGAFLNEVLAHLSVSLTPVEGTGAFTLDELRQATDINLINKLYEEVLGHEARFHGRSKAQAGSEGGSVT